MDGKKTLGDLVLVHWDADEAEELAAPLRAAGWRVKVGNFELKELKANPPVAVMISLRRLPSHGREVADALWYTNWGRAIPIVFFDGAPNKVEATRTRFPGAQFTTWEQLPSLLLHLQRKGEAEWTGSSSAYSPGSAFLWASPQSSDLRQVSKDCSG